MKKGRVCILNIIEKFFSRERFMVPYSINKALFNIVNFYFEEEAIECYFFDHQDIGFFESFMLGSDETKKLAKDSNRAIYAIKKSELLGKLSGYVVHKEKHINEEKEVVKDNIDSKKIKVVEMLKKKGEIIKYLGRRIVIKDEHLYERMEKIYTKIENILSQQKKKIN